MLRLVWLDWLAVGLVAVGAGCGGGMMSQADAQPPPPDAQPLPPDARPAPNGPPNSNSAVFFNGGGCYPAGINAGYIDQLGLINPEWSSVLAGADIDADPTYMVGTIVATHGRIGGDFPRGHTSSDWTASVKVDPAYRDLLGTGNQNQEPGEMEVEWEAVKFPAWMWPNVGDKMAVLGRWIFDCGHPDADPGHCSQTTNQMCILDSDCASPVCANCGSNETCVGAVFNYETEIHPPQAAATIRLGHGGLISDTPGAQPVPATRVDLYASPDGGAAGDRCILTHVKGGITELGFSTNCWPLSMPVARINATDFSVDVPLPPRPSPTATAGWRIVPYTDAGAGANPADVAVVSHENESPPHLTVTVKLAHSTQAGGLPTGYAGTLWAGWKQDTSPVVHLRVTVNELIVHNELHPKTPIVRDVKGWFFQTAVNGVAQSWPGLVDVSTGDTIAQKHVYDVWVPASGKLQVWGYGSAEACIDTLFHQSFMTDLAQMSLSDLQDCLETLGDPFAGQVLDTYSGPDFGAGSTGTATHTSEAMGGAGGVCKSDTSIPCVVSADCGGSDTCKQVGDAFALNYTIQKL